MTPSEADKIQKWDGMPGVNAWHLIERHADGWDEVGAMMDAWLRANLARALDQVTEEEPISGNSLAILRVRMKAARIRNNTE